MDVYHEWYRHLFTIKILMNFMINTIMKLKISDVNWQVIELK